MTALIQRYERNFLLNVVALRVSLRGVISSVSLMAARHRQRRQLKRLDEWRLKDVGLSRDQVLEEAAKPFWE